MKNNTVHNWRPEGDWIFAGLGKPYLSYTRRKCTRCGNVQTRVGTVHAVWVDGMNPINTHFNMKNSNERAACQG
jgi:hypothetical protein